MLEIKAAKSQIEALLEEIFTFSFNQAPGKTAIYWDERSLIIHLEDFMGAEMQRLIRQQDPDALRSVQELMIEYLLPKLAQQIKETTGLNIGNFYYDWSDRDLSCMLVGLPEEPLYRTQEDYYPGKDAVHQQIGKVTYEIEKVPDATYSYWAAEHILVIVREGILIKIEKAFIDQGATEILRKVKRNLEKTVIIREGNIGEVLNRKVQDVYLDWSFGENKSLLVHVFEK
ncbi:Na-translocating system protein MpsC family protein [Saccharibacillus kuerlensis]|uniref:Na+-translocating membrane potential-generating system MpsC domain-containing protein n=1 Tax=Saccharibacillus kuerlensis TaxID=459527 RepID=A0ABQ2L3M5_9BACL|nr:Na-translocating system protein MpsC family protein [Saccharibacillus kuerlensis]GGO01267.1 hypothetical protein GCM10010969_23400 [Saccharibacillus kuerlensis]